MPLLHGIQAPGAAFLDKNGSESKPVPTVMFRRHLSDAGHSYRSEAMMIDPRCHAHRVKDVFGEESLGGATPFSVDDGGAVGRRG
jgi:hypothetical protein